jgi:hypothetical protein
MLHLFCILLLIGFAAGCGDDEPVAPPVAPPQAAGTIGVYADADGSVQNLADIDGVVTVYVVHKVEDGATASNFRIQAPAGWTRLSAESEYPVAIGDFDNGISIGYGACRSGAIHVATLTYRSTGDTPAGAMFRVLPHNQWPECIQVADCEFNVLENGRGLESPIVDAYETESNQNSKRNHPYSQQ